MRTLIIQSVLLFNAFPPNNGVSDKVAPGRFLGGRIIDFNKHCRSGFGSYVQTHDEN